jgi:replicative DNA helicase
MSATYNENLEAHVLSILLKDGSTYQIVEDALEKDVFGWKPFGIVYQTIVDIVNSDMYPDIETIAVDLDRRNLLQVISIPSNGIKGREALDYIQDLEVNIEMLESYAIQMLELHGNKKLLSVADKIREYVEKRGKRPVETLSMIDFETGKISSYVGSQSKNTRTSKEVAEENIKQFEDVLEGKSLYILTGLDAWDDYVGGLFPRLYMIAAEQNEGKSTLVLNLINNIAIKYPKEVQNWLATKVKLFTFESSAEEINNKLVQMQTGISQIRIEKGELSTEELIKYKEALKNISESPIVYDDSFEITLPLLRTKIRKAVGDGAKVIFIDQLEQIMIGGSGDLQQEHIRLNYITYRIKAYQREQNVPIILVHQNKKVSGGQEGRSGTIDHVLNHLNQAGGKAPDAVLMVRTTKEPAFFWVKNRQGKKGKRKVNWDGSRLSFSDVPGLSEFGDNPDFLQEEIGNN